MFLSDKDVQELTGRKQKNAQQEILKFMGIEHRVRPDGSLVVLKEHVERVLGLVSGEAKTRKKKFEPDFSALKL